MNYTMKFSKADDTISKILEKSIEVGLHSLSENYGSTGLVSKFSLSDYHKESEIVKKAVLKYCAENSGMGEITSKEDITMAFSNPQFEFLFNSIQAQSLMGIMTRVQSPQILSMANIATVGLGDSYTWEIDPKGLPVAQRASYLSNVTINETFVKSGITVTPQQYSIGVDVDYIRIIANDYDWGRELARVAMGMLYAQYKLIVGLVFDTANATSLYNATFTAAKYVKTASDLTALNGSRPTAFGALPAWQKISALASQGGLMATDKYIDNGYLQKIFGVNSVIIDQATDFSAPLNAGVPEVLVPEGLIVMLSGVGDKPVKLVRENFIRIIKQNNTDGAQNKVAYSYFMGFDAAIATQAHFALQNVAGA